MKTDSSKSVIIPAKTPFIGSCAGLFALALLSACALTRSPDTAAATPATAVPAQSNPTVSSPAAAVTGVQAPTQQAPTNAPAVTPQVTDLSSAPVPASPEKGAAMAQAKQNASDSELALMRIEIMSLKEKMASVQRKLELVLKAQRSGLYEAENIDSIQAAVKNAEPKKNFVPPLGSAGPLDRFETDFERSGHEKALTTESAQKLVDRALSDLAQGDFARVAQSLEGFQQRFPSHPLSNSVELALAEAYVELKSPQQALPHLRTFYLQHPNDVQMYRAKWLEARLQEQLQAPQKAAQLYREVIALSPQSDAALRARAALERINGGTMQ